MAVRAERKRCLNFLSEPKLTGRRIVSSGTALVLHNP